MELNENFNWGTSSLKFINAVSREVFDEDHYERIYQVKSGDVVLDLGSSVGPFSWKVLDRASKIYCFEPTPSAYETLEQNFKDYPNVIIVKKALYHTTGKFLFPFNEDLGEPCGTMSSDEEMKIKEDKILIDTITFNDFLKEYKLDRIDYIKTDCEGGEYSLFRDENISFLKHKVRNIVGEWHLVTEKQKIEFRYFRDKFLKNHFKDYHINSVGDLCDITWSVFQNELYDSINEKNLPPFIEYYTLIHIHIQN